MKLYEIPPKTWVRLEDNSILFFDHLDGMYSYCLTEDKQVAHPVAWTEVEIILEAA